MKKNFLFLFILTYINIFSQDEEINKYLIPKEKIGLNKSNLRIDGFYYTKFLRVFAKKDTVKFIQPLILFKNGAVSFSDYLGNGTGTIRKKVLGKECYLKMPNYKDYKHIVSFFKCYSPTLKTKKVNNFFSIEGKLIRIQTIINKTKIERKGLILNDSTFIIKKLIDYNTKKIEVVNLIYYYEKSLKPKQPKFNYKLNFNEKIIHYDKQKVGKISKEILNKIRNQLSSSANKQIDSSQTIVINYFPAPDKCQGKEKWNSFFLNKVNRYVKKIEKKENVQQFFIFKDKKSIKNFDKKFTCFLDENQLIEKTFFKFHYPCFSYVIIRPNGNYFSQRGEYNISLIPDKL